MLIIPAIDLKEGRCVRLTQGDMSQETVFAENPAEQAKKWENAGAGMIHIVDLDGAVEGRPKNEKAIRDICRAAGCPVQLGGGIRSMETARNYFDLGLSRIVLGTLLIKNPELALEISNAYPGRVLAGIDVKNNMATSDGWLGTSGITGAQLASKINAWPLAGIVFTDISRDGMMRGANIEAIRQMAASTTLPLIASGGISSRSDLDSLASIKEVAGAIIGKALYTGAIDLQEAIRDYQC